MKEDYNWMHNPPEEKKFNPLTHMSDQDRISPYNIIVSIQYQADKWWW